MAMAPTEGVTDSIYDEVSLDMHVLEGVAVNFTIRAICAKFQRSVWLEQWKSPCSTGRGLVMRFALLCPGAC